MSLREQNGDPAEVYTVSAQDAGQHSAQTVLGAVRKCLCGSVSPRVGAHTYAVCRAGAEPPWNVQFSFSDALIFCVSVPSTHGVLLFVYHYTSNFKFLFWTGILVAEFKIHTGTGKWHRFSPGSLRSAPLSGGTQLSLSPARLF